MGDSLKEQETRLSMIFMKVLDNMLNKFITSLINHIKEGRE